MGISVSTVQSICCVMIVLAASAALLVQSICCVMIVLAASAAYIQVVWLMLHVPASAGIL